MHVTHFDARVEPDGHAVFGEPPVEQQILLWVELGREAPEP
jgi:hypothetical protein